MARIPEMPSREIIDSFKGTLDFYLYKGQACVRKWPTWHRRFPSPPEKAAQEVFGYAASMWAALPSIVQQAYIQMAISLPVTGRDIFVRSYINGNRP